MKGDDDYKKKKKDIQADPNTPKDPELKKELTRRKAELEKEFEMKQFIQRRIGIGWGISRSSRTLSSVSSRADSRHADAELSASAGLPAAASLPASSKLSPNTNLPPTHSTSANRGQKLGRQFYSEKLLGHLALSLIHISEPTRPY